MPQSFYYPLNNGLNLDILKFLEHACFRTYSLHPIKLHQTFVNGNLEMVEIKVISVGKRICALVFLKKIPFFSYSYFFSNQDMVVFTSIEIYFLFPELQWQN